MDILWLGNGEMGSMESSEQVSPEGTQARDVECAASGGKEGRNVARSARSWTYLGNLAYSTCVPTSTVGRGLVCVGRTRIRSQRLICASKARVCQSSASEAEQEDGGREQEKLQ